MKQDVVFITSRFPYPLNKGDKLRAFWQIKGLSEYMNVHLISLSEQDVSPQSIEALNPYCKSINNFVLSKPRRYLRMLLDVFSNRPLSVSYFYNPRIKKSISRLMDQISPDYIHCHMIRTALYMDHTKACITSIDYMDCFSLGALKELTQPAPNGADYFYKQSTKGFELLKESTIKNLTSILSSATRIEKHFRWMVIGM